ncbi:MAG: PorT family protein [Bacteroidales bacterium]|nr:PorT family protein [Bacteroidales bacterium]
MKKALKALIITLFISAIAIPAQAQRRTVHYLANYENEPYHFGFLLAYNQMMYTIKTVDGYQNIALPASSWPGTVPFNIANTQSLYVYNIETKQTPGFTVGILGSKRLGRYFDLRFIPTLSFSDRQLKYDIVVLDKQGNQEMKHLEKAIFTTFVEFPLNIKYRSKRYNNIGAYIFGGINPKLDLASQKKNTIYLLDETGEPITDENGNPISTINNLVTKRFDVAGELGIGFDIYNQWFRLGIEIKMSYGLLDVVKRGATDKPLIYTASIDQLRNKMFQLSFLFE